MGKDSNKVEQKEAIPTSQEYLRTHPGSRDPDTPVILIKQGFEPLTFTGWFTAWDPVKWSGGNSYEEMVKEFGEEAPLPVNVENEETRLGENGQEEERTYDPHPAEDLVHKQTSDLPERVDPVHKERHLSDSDFQDIFQLSKEEFGELAEWKQLKLKKDKGFF